MSYRGQPNGVDGKGPRGVEDSAERGDPVLPTSFTQTGSLWTCPQVAILL